MNYTCGPRGRVGQGSISTQCFSSEPLSEHQLTEPQPVLIKNSETPSSRENRSTEGSCLRTVRHSYVLLSISGTFHGKTEFLWL